MTDGNFQGLPRLQLDGTTEHPVYATAGNGTKGGRQPRPVLLVTLVRRRPAPTSCIEPKAESPGCAMQPGLKGRVLLNEAEKSARAGIGRAADTVYRIHRHLRRRAGGLTARERRQDHDRNYRNNSNRNAQALADMSGV